MSWNLSMTEAVDYPGMYKPRPTKSKNGGIGGGRKKNLNKIKPVSKKQRKRTNGLQDKLEMVLEAQERIYGQRICEATRGHENWKYKCPCVLGRPGKLVLDHVEGRNNENADRFENLQAICHWSNYVKGSIRGLDFRTPEMVAEMKKLDEKESK